MNRALPLASALAISYALLANHVQAQQFRLYIGTYTTGESASEGIYSCVFDAASGQLSEPQLAIATVNPSFLAIHPSGRFLFAVNEVHEGSGRGQGYVSAFHITPDGQLSSINRQPSHGGTPCHCSIDATGRFLLIANYTGGNVAVYPIAEDGALGEATSVVEHQGSSIDPQRQRQPHAHSIQLSSDNRFAYAADLGIDQIRIYRFDDHAGTLAAASPAFAAITPGGGPRHFALHPSGRFAYTNHELTAVVTALSRDAETGALTPLQSLSTLPTDFDGRKSTAECLVHPSGRFLYVSNRGHDSIASYAIDQDSGQLSPLAITHTLGEEPRNFSIDPSGRWLLAANQNSDSVVVFALDPNSGALTPSEQSIAVGRPVCIRLLPLTPAQ